MGYLSDLVGVVVSMFCKGDAKLMMMMGHGQTFLISMDQIIDTLPKQLPASAGRPLLLGHREVSPQNSPLEQEGP